MTKNPTKGDALSVFLSYQEGFAKKGLYTFTASAVIAFLFFLLEVFAWRTEIKDGENNVVQCGKEVNDVPLGTYQEAKKSKKLLESFTGKEYEIIEYYKSGEYYVRRKPKDRLTLRRWTGDD